MQFLRIAGTTLADPIVDDGTLTGRVADVIHQLDDRMAAQELPH